MKMTINYKPFYKAKQHGSTQNKTRDHFCNKCAVEVVGIMAVADMLKNKHSVQDYY